MTYGKRFPQVFSVLFVLICTGCSSYPEGELQQAQAAMDEALKHQPEVYAAANWRDAQKAWNDAQALLSQQKYGQAAPTLVTAKTRFAKAGQIAREKREAVLKEVTEAQHDIHVRHTRLKGDLAAAHLSAPVRKSLEECCRQLEQQVEKLNTEIDKSELLKAQATAKETLKLVYEGQVKLEAATKKSP